MEPQQKSSIDSKPIMIIPNFFPSTSCIESILTGKTNDCHQEDKSSMDSNTDLQDNKNIDPLRDRLNKRLSEAVHHTITTSMNNTAQINNNSKNIIINDTLSALVINGYKTRGLKKAERIFSMTMK
nr:SJCHGC04534 protein [Schistosoma japonicum]